MRKYYYIVAYDGLNREYYEEVYETEHDRLQGLKEFIERDMLDLSEKEMEDFLKNKFFNYGYDWIELVEK